ncbi:MAG: hypothetical protein IKY62_06850, partial [Clostridia bacterium]|nr:hypothetical protein [Clostridia bacterium]
MSGVPSAMNSTMLAALFLDKGKRIVALFPDERDATLTHKELSTFGIRALFLPARDMFFGKVDAKGHDFDYIRLSVLSQVARGEWDILLTTAEAFCQTTVPHHILQNPRVTLEPGLEVEMETLCSDFVDMGYKKCEIVDGKGQFSKRGGILDIFPSHLDFPLRIEFFGDEIDTVSAFDIITQRRVDTLKKVSILPAFEIFADSEGKERLKNTFSSLAGSEKREEVKEALFRQIEALENTNEIEYELFADIIFDKVETLADYVTDATLCVFESGKVRERLESSYTLAKEAIESLCESRPELWATSAYVGQRGYSFFKDELSDANTIIFNSFVTGEDYKYRDIFKMNTRKTVSMAQNAELFFDDVENYVSRGYDVVILSANSISAVNL